MNAEKTFFQANWFKLFIVSLSLFLIGLYFYRDSQLNDCLVFSHMNYKKNWESQCKQIKQVAECSLPRAIAEALETDRERQVNECFRRYSFFPR